MKQRSKNSLYQAECWSNHSLQATDKAESYQRISESFEREADEHEEQYARYNHRWLSEKEATW